MVVSFPEMGMGSSGFGEGSGDSVLFGQDKLELLSTPASGDGDRVRLQI